MSVLKLRNVRHYDVMPTADSLLGVATPEELAKYVAGRAKMDAGKIWDGYFKPALEAMDKATRDKILKSLDDYGNELGKSKAEEQAEAKGLTFGGQNEDDEEEQQNWPSTTNDSPMRQWRNQDFRKVDQVQKSINDFYKRK